MALGQWIGQFNTRAIASPFTINITQTGTSVDGRIKYLSQMLLNDASPPTSNNWGVAASRMGLVAQAYPSAGQQGGVAGYRHFMRWVKQQVVQGAYVTLGVIEQGGGKPYGHIVNVVRVQSDFPANDTSYHGTDVLWIDDHGLYTRMSSHYGSPSADNTAGI